ncbi:hypothetical protein [Pedobacter jeongneungensis]|uniref:hypothetical protein n=1 Tax=Pedobacter jeongneungensis TaxID=947309 RepID=UPI00046AAED8|nr:hypothetical protein [Pedobacter jeongneungensis]
MEIEKTYNILLGILTIVGFGLTIYYGIKAAKSEEKLNAITKEQTLLNIQFQDLERQKRSIDFQDILSCANELKSDLLELGFRPDVIFAPGLRGATFANVLENEFIKDSLPVMVGISTWSNFDYFDNVVGYRILTTKKWQLLIPELLFVDTQRKLLIVDDFAMTGDFLSILKEELIKHGYLPHNLKSITIATTRVAIENKTAPDLYWRENVDSNFFFPWGKAK